MLEQRSYDTGVMATPTASKTPTCNATSSTTTYQNRDDRGTSPVTHTPKNRISKAKKGKRVHDCTYPGCEKVFTRAEHLRRHQLNHTQKVVFNCKLCSKVFFREDLLLRHSERHITKTSQAPSLTTNESSQFYRAYDHGIDNLLYPTTYQGQTIDAYQNNGANFGMPLSSQPSNARTGLIAQQLDQSTTTRLSSHPGRPLYPTHFSTGSQDGSYDLNSSEGSCSPASGCGTSQYTQSQTSLHSEYQFDGNQAANPSILASPVESLVRSSFWQTQSPLVPDAHQDYNYNTTASISPVHAHHLSMTDVNINYGRSMPPTSTPLSTMAPQLPLPISNRDISATTWQSILSLLQLSPTATSILGLDISSAQLYIHLYWDNFHPTCEILHKPTFFPDLQQPLLIAAILAIGACYTSPQMLDVGHFIHAKLVERLAHVQSGEHWVLQTTLLCQKFDELYHIVKNDQLR